MQSCTEASADLRSRSSKIAHRNDLVAPDIMKVMFVCPVICKLQEMTMRLDLYHAGMAALGHELIVVCKRGAEVGFPYRYGRLPIFATWLILTFGAPWAVMSS